ncbi:MAG: chorismate synthase [Thermodesulfovibrio sp.]|nr:chorismate synthase [Thermodesulfovibrio sp.]MDW7998087.1 chorismate synthase [Thermodesulfovibrio sp.]
MLRFLTAGESHGKGLTGIVEGMPSGVEILVEEINNELKRRQQGYGRGARMKIESDRVEILSGIRWGKTLGSPITLFIKNRDWDNWEKAMNPEKEYEGMHPPLTKPRPGHADLAGLLKYQHLDIRNVLERSSARETAMRVAIGAMAKQFLKCFNIKIGSFVIGIGPKEKEIETAYLDETELLKLSILADNSIVRTPWKEKEDEFIEVIEKAIKNGDTVGGSFIVFATAVPPGLGSHVHWDRKLDAKIASGIMSIQAIKAVEIGDGVSLGKSLGSKVMDEIFYSKKRSFYRKTNHLGGIEGGISNGMPVIVKATMKPIPTLRKALNSVDIFTKESSLASYERSDVCAVPAASVIGEAVLAWHIAEAFVEKFGGDSLEEVRKNFSFYIKQIVETKWLKNSELKG